MKLRRIPLPEPVYLMRCTVPAQRMSLSIQQRTMAGLSVAASRTAEPDVPAVVLLQAREAPFELEWSLSPTQARALAARLLDAAANCNRLDSVACHARCD
ncbi:hypothetical protein [Hydrogenophaga sp. ANAO-22]|uniref:hypothetical protein n=1 Tax=Hydrogenophaga sp. ANAO-22 TaxID=3166645 RepID=UPI0036D30DEA